MRRALLLLAPLLLLVQRPGPAQILRLDLADMVSRTDGAVFATIVDKTTFRAGEDLYFTTLHLEGRSLVDGRETTVEVTYPGGFVDDDEGVWNSEAPFESDVQPGNRIVAFYKWLDDLGGGVAGNVLYASHGGLFRTVLGPGGRVVLGRGEGYAVRQNVRLDDLDRAVSILGQ